MGDGDFQLARGKRESQSADALSVNEEGFIRVERLIIGSIEGVHTTGGKRGATLFLFFQVVDLRLCDKSSSRHYKIEFEWFEMMQRRSFQRIL